LEEERRLVDEAVCRYCEETRQSYSPNIEKRTSRKALPTIIIADNALPLWMWGVKEKDMAYINSQRENISN
jgi:hypothetical protein